MSEPKPTHTQPGGFVQEDHRAEDGVVNDSLGTVDPADATGLGEEKEPGQNRPEKSHPRQD